MKIPCKDCITLPICLSLYRDRYKSFNTYYQSISIPLSDILFFFEITKKCTLSDEFLNNNGTTELNKQLMKEFFKRLI